MHPLLASTAMGLVAAWPVGALGLGLGRLVERLTDDPRPRAAAWSLAYALPAAALAATVALTFTPRDVTSAPAAVAVAVAAPAIAEPGWAPPEGLMTDLAWSLVGLSAAGLLARGWRWNRGRRRLAAVRASARPCQDTTLIEAVRLRACALGVTAPRVRISADVAGPLLAGARRPVILLPEDLARTQDPRRLELVCGHELAHLRRGDNWRIPVEEAVAGLFWLAPPVAALRGRMLAAREAVCDLTALDGAAPEARRDYARVLVEALRVSALASPQMTFESAFTGHRALARMRLSAILQPRGDASALRVGLVVALGGALTALTGFGSLALADQARCLTPAEATPAKVAPLDAVAPIGPVEPVAAVDAVDAVEPAEAAPAIAMTATVAEAAPAAPAAPMTSPYPLPDPHPDPHPAPSPNPQPRPHATPASVIEEMRASPPSRREVVFLGDVAVKDALEPVQVNLKVNSVASPSLKVGKIQRLEITDQRVARDGKITVNVVMNGADS